METKNSKYCGCLYYAANALGRIMTKMAEEEFAVTGLKPSYALLLLSVNEKSGIQPKELCEHMQLTPSTVTRLIEKLELKGLVERKSAGRATQVFATEKGRALDGKVKTAWKSLYKRYSEALGEETAKKLTSDTYAASKALGA
jgi:DNA-binding MarR family transcriptional regulator